MGFEKFFDAFAVFFSRFGLGASFLEFLAISSVRYFMIDAAGESSLRTTTIMRKNRISIMLVPKVSGDYFAQILLLQQARGCRRLC